jgi:hypothetical protein
MNSTELPKAEQEWSLHELIGQEPGKKKGLIQWWFNLTAIPDAPSDASFWRRELARKSHLISAITFFLLLIFTTFIPGCLIVPNHYILYVDLGMIIVCVAAIFANRAQQIYLAGALLTIAFELALTVVIFTTMPLDEPSIQQYELFVFGELLCVSLLNPSSVFLTMLYNIGIITVSLLWQTQTAILSHDLQTQFLAIWLRPVAVQFLVASVTYLWVKSSIRAIERADRAEMIAKLEHEIAEQKQHLEEGIKRIMETHVEIANGNLSVRAPLTQDNDLWQIAQALNTLLVRLQRAVLAEKALQRVESAIASTVSSIQKTDPQQSLQLSLTQTEIDPLIVALQGKTVASGATVFFGQKSPQPPVRGKHYDVNQK